MSVGGARRHRLVPCTEKGEKGIDEKREES